MHLGLPQLGAARRSGPPSAVRTATTGKCNFPFAFTGGYIYIYIYPPPPLYPNIPPPIPHPTPPPLYPNAPPRCFWRCFFDSEKMTFLEISDICFIVFVIFSQYLIIFRSISFQQNINAKGQLHFARGCTSSRHPPNPRVGLWGAGWI
jgi:hypothetical protein